MAEPLSGPNTAPPQNRFDLAALALAAVDLVAQRYPSPRPRRPGVGFVPHARALKALSETFTTTRDEMPPGYMDRPPIRAAYLLYYLVTGAATAQAVLRLSGAGDDWLPADRPLRVLDLGAGPLSASLGLAAMIPGTALEVVAVDQSTRAMADGVRLFQALRPDVALTTRRLDLRARSAIGELGGGFDLVLSANLLNELRPESRRGRGVDPIHQLVFGLLARCLAPGGRVVLWEPGTRAAAGRLAGLRDALLAQERGHILGPCAGVETCPLGHPAADGWCHAERPWRRPPSIVALDEAIGHRRATLKFSWLTLAAAASPPEPRPGYRIIGGPMRDRDLLRRYLCGPEGRVVAMAREPDLPPDHPLRTAWRGDWLSDLGPTRERRGRKGERVFQLR